MDAFTVSIANGMHEPNMPHAKRCLISGTFAGFPGLMPMLGWVCVHTILTYFQKFSVLIPWIALLLLGFIGGKMIYEGVSAKGEAERAPVPALTLGTLMLQGIATAIDALSVGFTIAEYSAISALIASLLIAAVTFAFCLVGVTLGKRAGAHLADRATVIGGLLLIGIGLEIWISGVF